MWSVLRGRSLTHPTSAITQNWKIFASSFLLDRRFSTPSVNNEGGVAIGEKENELLSLAEVEKILKDVRADDVKVIQVPKRYEFADYMVVATGRSPWHVRNIAQALVYQVKQKQKGAKRLLLPSVVGQEGGKWIVIDSGKLIIHAVDEKARAYYNFEGLWTEDPSYTDDSQVMANAFVKIRPRRNNSKKPPSQAKS